jgi:hypothetical protein
MVDPTVGTALAARLPTLYPLQSDSGEEPIVFLVFLAVGLYLVYSGFQKWQQMRLIQDTPTEKIRSAAVGRTELSATAKPIDGVGTVERPFTEGEALVATYQIEEWEEDHDHDHDDAGRDGNWETIDSGTLSVPFEVDDGTGRMRVEPEDDATYEVSDENQTEFKVTGSPPAEVAEFFDRHYDDDDDGLLGGLLSGGPNASSHERRRYSQEVIPPGADLYLLGGAQPVDGASGTNAERLVLGRDEGSEEFIISDMAEEELVSGYKWAAPAQIVAGIALSAGMVYLLVA